MTAPDTAREILGSNIATLMAKSEAYGSAPAIERASEKLGCKVGRSTVDRAKAGTTPLNLDYIAVLAKLFKRKPWELLHPTLGNAGNAQEAPTLSQALEVLAAVLNDLPDEARREAAQRLGTLALAPDSSKARDAFLATVQPQASDKRADGSTPEPSVGVPINPQFRDELEQLQKAAEEMHGKPRRKRHPASKS